MKRLIALLLSLTALAGLSACTNPAAAPKPALPQVTLQQAAFLGITTAEPYSIGELAGWKFAGRHATTGYAFGAPAATVVAIAPQLPGFRADRVEYLANDDLVFVFPAGAHKLLADPNDAIQDGYLPPGMIFVDPKNP